MTRLLFPLIFLYNLLLSPVSYAVNNTTYDEHNIVRKDIIYNNADQRLRNTLFEYYDSQSRPIINRNKPGRKSDSEITIFKSVGISAQDVAVAKLVYDRALKEGIGKDIDF